MATTKRITITLSDEEFEKLALLARDTLRTPSDEARHLLQGILFGDGLSARVRILEEKLRQLQPTQCACTSLDGCELCKMEKAQ